MFATPAPKIRGEENPPIREIAFARKLLEEFSPGIADHRPGACNTDAEAATRDSRSR
jgi:hypothetical protein